MLNQGWLRFDRIFQKNSALFSPKHNVRVGLKCKFPLLLHSTPAVFSLITSGLVHLYRIFEKPLSIRLCSWLERESVDEPRKARENFNFQNNKNISRIYCVQIKMCVKFYAQSSAHRPLLLVISTSKSGSKGLSSLSMKGIVSSIGENAGNNFDKSCSLAFGVFNHEGIGSIEGLTGMAWMQAKFTIFSRFEVNL